MKRFFAVLLIIIVMAALFCSCRSEGNETPLTVNSTPIDGEIFRYFLNEAWQDEALTTKEERSTRATHLCIRYVAVNSTFEREGLLLSAAERAQAYSQGNALWRLFGDFYKSIGVSKESYLKIKISEQYTEKLRTAIFGEGGTQEISEGALRGCLYENFAAFRLIKTPLKTTDVYGNERAYSEEELAALKARYADEAAEISSAAAMDAAYSSLAADSMADEGALETIVIDENDHNYPAQFFRMIKQMEENSAELMEDGSYLYLIYRVNILSDAAIFTKYKDECLRLLSEAPLQSIINEMCNGYTSHRSTQLVDEYYREVARVKK